MANPYFRFKKFTVYHDRCAMKVTTDSCFFGGWAAEDIRNSKVKIDTVLDIGAGSGLLALMVAQKNEAEIDAVEIDSEAALQAKENVAASPWKNRIQVFNEDILGFLPGKKYDVIISNPPFYENELASGAHKKNMAHHSSQLRISQVIQLIKTHLKESGSFFLMYPFKRKAAIERLVTQNGLHINRTVILNQSEQHQPFRVIIKGSYANLHPSTTETVSVWDEHRQYTPGFTGVLRDYYLYL